MGSGRGVSIPVLPGAAGGLVDAVLCVVGLPRAGMRSGGPAHVLWGRLRPQPFRADLDTGRGM
eukprot:1532477-Pleurochrysis_carterae.AAC.1